MRIEVQLKRSGRVELCCIRCQSIGCLIERLPTVSLDFDEARDAPPLRTPIDKLSGMLQQLACRADRATAVDRTRSFRCMLRSSTMMLRLSVRMLRSSSSGQSLSAMAIPVNSDRIIPSILVFSHTALSSSGYKAV